MMKLSAHDAPKQFAAAMARRVDFRVGPKFYGRKEEGGARTLGDLPAEHHESARIADYVVYHGDTPIAWREVTDEGAHLWIAPSVDYGSGAKRAQNLIRAALKAGTGPWHDLMVAT